MLSQRADRKKIDRNGKTDKEKKLWIVSHAFIRKNRMCSWERRNFLYPPMNRKWKRLSEKVSFCASKLRKASLTLETAMVLPLFLLGMMTMISFMDIYRLQTEHLSKLCQNVMQSGMYAYGTDGNGPQELTLPDVYSYQPLGGLLPLRKVWFYNQVKVHTWTGKDAGAWEHAGEEDAEEMVYVTVSGGVYHLDENCTYLKPSVTAISGNNVASRRNGSGEKYHACEICSRNQDPAGTVYITKEGNRYHNHANCSGLKRTVRLVCKSDVEGMGVCSKCGKHHS